MVGSNIENLEFNLLCTVLTRAMSFILTILYMLNQNKSARTNIFVCPWS